MKQALLSPSEVADLLGVPVKTLEQWRWKGTGPRFLRLPSRAVRYDAAELENWLDSRRMRSTSDRPGAEDRP